MSKAEEAALAAANTVLDEDSVEAEETPSEPTEPVAEEVQQETVEEELPEEVPEEIKAIWDEPDFEEEAEAEIQAEVPEDEEYVDDETATLRQQLRAAEKKIAWQEEQKLKQNAPNWKKEALRYTPYCEPLIDEIAAKATSRRGLLREAKRVNDLLQPWAEAKYTKPEAEQMDALRAQLKEEIKAEMSEAWGQPTVVVGDVPSEAGEARSKLEALRAAGAPLEKLVLARKDAGEYDNL